MANIINEEQLAALIGKELNAAMVEAAEPILQKALKDIEQTMRETMAARLISFIQNDLILERMGRDIRIIVKQATTEK